MNENTKPKAPELTPAMRAEVERFGIHPELNDVTEVGKPLEPAEQWWASLSDDQLAHEINAASARIDAAEHTKRSLMREMVRRHSKTGKAS